MGSKGIVGGLAKPLLGDGGADAAQAAGTATYNLAREGYRQYAKASSAATMQGLASFDRDIKEQEKNLARQEQLISQIDPTIIEASQQALRLLRGDKAASLGPLEQQRAQQRQKLVNTLRQQLGPGAETSQAGLKALTQFDQETSGLFSNAQQNAMQGLASLGGQFTQMRPDMLRELGALSGYGQGKAQLGLNQAQGVFNARQPLLGAVGGQWAGDMMRGQQQSAFNMMALQGAAGAMGAGGFGALGSGLKSMGNTIGGWFSGGGGSAGGTAPMSNASDSTIKGYAGVY